MLTAALSWCILVKCPGGEMVDTADLKSAVFGHAGSSPAPGTNNSFFIERKNRGVLNDGLVC